MDLRDYVFRVLDQSIDAPDGWDPRVHTVACTAGVLLESRHWDEFQELRVLVAAWMEQHP